MEELFKQLKINYKQTQAKKKYKKIKGKEELKKKRRLIKRSNNFGNKEKVEYANRKWDAKVDIHVKSAQVCEHQVQ